MGWWQVSTDALAGGRFVISPLAETTASLLALEHGTAAHPGERRWLDTHRAAYFRHAKEHPAIPAILRAAVGRRWIPLLITVPPAALGGSCFGDELRLIADLHPARVTSDLAEVGLVPASDDLPRQAVSLLDWVWTNTVLPYWPIRRRILEADIAARTTRLGRDGWTKTLSDMRPGARWLGGGRLQINASDRPPREVPGAAQLFFGREGVGGRKPTVDGPNNEDALPFQPLCRVDGRQHHSFIISVQRLNTRYALIRWLQGQIR